MLYLSRPMQHYTTVGAACFFFFFTRLCFGRESSWHLSLRGEWDASCLAHAECVRSVCLGLAAFGTW